MTTLNIDLVQDIVLKGEDKKKLSFLVSRVIDEYFEDKNDTMLKSEIENSKELDSIINNINI